MSQPGNPTGLILNRGQRLSTGSDQRSVASCPSGLRNSPRSPGKKKKGDNRPWGEGRNRCTEGNARDQGPWNTYLITQKRQGTTQSHTTCPTPTPTQPREREGTHLHSQAPRSQLCFIPEVDSHLHSQQTFEKTQNRSRGLRGRGWR